MVRPGLARLGLVGLGAAWQARHGGVRPGQARLGRAGWGLAGRGTVRQAVYGLAG